MRRFTSRTRHPGHLDAQLAQGELAAAAAQPPAFMDLPGPRFAYDSDAPAAYAQLLTDAEKLAPVIWLLARNASNAQS